MPFFPPLLPIFRVKWRRRRRRATSRSPFLPAFMERERRRRGNIPPFHVVGGRYVRQKFPSSRGHFSPSFHPSCRLQPRTWIYVSPGKRGREKSKCTGGGASSLFLFSLEIGTALFFVLPRRREAEEYQSSIGQSISSSSSLPPSLQAGKGVSVRSTMGLPFPPSIPRRRLSSGRGPLLPDTIDYRYCLLLRLRLAPLLNRQSSRKKEEEEAPLFVRPEAVTPFSERSVQQRLRHYC